MNVDKYFVTLKQFIALRIGPPFERGIQSTHSIGKNSLTCFRLLARVFMTLLYLVYFGKSLCRENVKHTLTCDFVGCSGGVLGRLEHKKNKQTGLEM